MKKIVIFEDEDATHFNSEAGCLKYEAVLTKVTAALGGVWHPGYDNSLFYSGRQPFYHPKGTRERLAASLVPIFREAIRAPFEQMPDVEYLDWLSSYFYGHVGAWPCIRKAHHRLMSIDYIDREWCDPATCRAGRIDPMSFLRQYAGASGQGDGLRVPEADTFHL